MRWRIILYNYVCDILLQVSNEDTSLLFYTHSKDEVYQWAQTIEDAITSVSTAYILSSVLDVCGLSVICSRRLEPKAAVLRRWKSRWNTPSLLAVVASCRHQ